MNSQIEDIGSRQGRWIPGTTPEEREEAERIERDMWLAAEGRHPFIKLKPTERITLKNGLNS